MQESLLNKKMNIPEKAKIYFEKVKSRNRRRRSLGTLFLIALFSGSAALIYLGEAITIGIGIFLFFASIIALAVIFPSIIAQVGAGSDYTQKIIGENYNKQTLEKVQQSIQDIQPEIKQQHTEDGSDLDPHVEYTETNVLESTYNKLVEQAYDLMCQGDNKNINTGIKILERLANEALFQGTAEGSVKCKEFGLNGFENYIKNYPSEKEAEIKETRNQQSGTKSQQHPPASGFKTDSTNRGSVAGAHSSSNSKAGKREEGPETPKP